MAAVVEPARPPPTIATSVYRMGIVSEPLCTNIAPEKTKKLETTPWNTGVSVPV
jgi:hypothetical protein